ncbi:hypothetical protein IV102_36415 [bacterium]|nr:hypothetical protein [bacterium]
MDSAGFLLGILVACLHWWQFEQLCNNLGEHLLAGRVVKLAARRWGLTFLLGMVSLQWAQVKAGEFMTGFLVASFVARAITLFRHRGKEI